MIRTQIGVALVVLAAAGVVLAETPDPRLLAVEPGDVIRLGVALAGAEPYVLFLRQGQWTMKDPSTMPEGFRFDSQSAAELVAGLVDLKAVRFETLTGKAEEALGPKRDVFRLTTRHGKSSTLHVGAVAAGRALVWRQGSEELAVVSEAFVTNLRKLPPDFRSLELVDFAPGDVVALTLAEGKTRMLLAKTGLADARAQATLEALAAARALAVVEEPVATGLDEPSAEIIAVLADSSEVRVVLGARGAIGDVAGWYARTSADAAAVFFVSEPTRQKLLVLLR